MMHKSLKIAVSTAALLVATAGTAAATDYVGGGQWNHGTDATWVWSNYYHKTNCHGATSVGERTVRRDASKGQWADTTTPAKLFGNKAYWRSSC
jgi:lactococcin 972 family bacteriocin